MDKIHLDGHCMKIVARYANGEVSESMANWLMREHGDSIMAKIFENGFTTEVGEEYKNLVGSKGTS